MSTASSCHPNKLAFTYAALLLRFWLAARAIQTGIEKFAGSKAADKVVTIDGAANSYGLTAGGSVKSYGWVNYHGVPESLMAKFQAEPMMIKAALPLYDKILGPALIVLGITILLGIAQRTSLFLLGLLYISLTWGLILLKQDEGISWLGIHVVLVVLALALAEHNRFALLKKW
jgi:thiosulfate dehydrogenase (quinone) large subunit